MHQLCWTVCRAATAAWVGAAALFVVVAVREVRNAAFDSTVKDQLALLRFPAYYLFGFVLVGCGILGALGALASSPSPRDRPPRGIWRLKTAIALLLVAAAIMAVDYGWVYRPMVAILSPPGRSKTDNFREYHRASEALNSCNVALCAVAAALLCWPRDVALADNPLAGRM